MLWNTLIQLLNCKQAHCSWLIDGGLGLYLSQSESVPIVHSV